MITELIELTQDRGNRLLEGTKKPCVHQDPEERSSDPTRDRPRLARLSVRVRLSVQESMPEVWVGSGLLQGHRH